VGEDQQTSGHCETVGQYKQALMSLLSQITVTSFSHIHASSDYVKTSYSTMKTNILHQWVFQELVTYLLTL
jgi:hypothetical protein